MLAKCVACALRISSRVGGKVCATRAKKLSLHRKGRIESRAVSPLRGTSPYLRVPIPCVPRWCVFFRRLEASRPQSVPMPSALQRGARKLGCQPSDNANGNGTPRPATHLAHVTAPAASPPCANGQPYPGNPRTRTQTHTHARTHIPEHALAHEQQTAASRVARTAQADATT